MIENRFPKSVGTKRMQCTRPDSVGLVLPFQFSQVRHRFFANVFVFEGNQTVLEKGDLRLREHLISKHHQH